MIEHDSWYTVNAEWLKEGFMQTAWDGNLHEVLEYLKGRVMEMQGF